MRTGESTRMALQNLWGHKLRSLLTIIGVLIGIGSIIAIVSLSAAFEYSITSQFDEIDDRSIFVTAASAANQNGPPDAGQFGTVFTETDRQALADIDGVERVIASGNVAVTTLRTDARALPFQQLTATNSDADDVRHAELYHTGGPFTDGAPEIVLGWNLALALGADPPTATEPSLAVGDGIVVTFPDNSTRDVTVAGILVFQESLFGTGNGAAHVPLDPFYMTFRDSPSSGSSDRVFDGFTVIAKKGVDINDVRDAVNDYMQDSSDATTLLTDLDVLILVATASDITQQIGVAFDQVTIFVAGIAGVSLLVGGIMIATIQLISVTERTKEIGLMKAIGALDRDVLRLFLVESMIIGFVGSIAGIAVGLGAGAAMVAAFFGNESTFIVPYGWIGIAVGVGILTGIVAGYLPARRATKIQPVEALNYE